MSDSSSDDEAQRPRRRRGETREERLYGVFAEDSEDSETRKRATRRGPVAFVSGGRVPREQEAAIGELSDSSAENGGRDNSDESSVGGEKDDNEDDEEEEELDDALPSWIGDTSSHLDQRGKKMNDLVRQMLSRVSSSAAVDPGAKSSGGSAAPTSTRLRPDAAVADRLVKGALGSQRFRKMNGFGVSNALGGTEGAEVDLDSAVQFSSSATAPVKKIAEFERHTKGFASKYLAKFNFEGRLGKEEKGISKPFEVKVRPNQLGLGFGGFKEATTLKSNREVERELRAANKEGGGVDEVVDSEEEREKKRAAERDRRKDPQGKDHSHRQQRKPREGKPRRGGAASAGRKVE